MLCQGPLKALCFPGLNCCSCPAASMSYPMGALRQLRLGIGFSIETGSCSHGSYLFGTVDIIASLTARLTCGWLCPFGFLQEMLYKIPSGRKFQTAQPLKHFILVFWVTLFPLKLTDQRKRGKAWICKSVCPAGTIEAGIPMLILQPDLRETWGYLFYNKLVWMIWFLIWSIFSGRPFCKTTCHRGCCYGMFNKISLFQLQLNKQHCTDCGSCLQVCPMDINSIKTSTAQNAFFIRAVRPRRVKFEATSIHCTRLPLALPPQKPKGPKMDPL